MVEPSALYQAVRAERVVAGLDVWYSYPKTEEDRASTAPAPQPFGELDGVVLSPHRGGLVDSTETSRTSHLAELLRALLVGSSPAPNRVDLEEGY